MDFVYFVVKQKFQLPWLKVLFNESIYWAIASKKKRIRSGGIKSKPPPAAPGGKDNVLAILELASLFIHEVGEETCKLL